MNQNQAQLKQVFEQAVALHQAGKPGAAEPLYQQLLIAAPANFTVLHLLGVAQAQMGRAALAAETLAKAVKADPNAADGWMNYGNALSANGRKDEALKAYARAVSLQPNYVEALFNQGLMLLEMQRPAEALASIDRALALRPDYVEAWNNRGVAMEMMNRHVEALAAYDKIMALRPNDPESFNKRGVALWNLNRRNEALVCFDRALIIKPDYVEAWVNLANALRHVRRLDESLAACDRALALNPSYVPALQHRGIALWELRRLDEALASYDKALRIEPNNPSILNDRAVALRRLRRFDEALAGFDAVLAAMPRFAGAAFNRANVLGDLKRHAEALAAYERTLELDPNESRALSGLADMALNVCDWQRVQQISGRLAKDADKMLISPLVLIHYGVDPALQLKATQNFVKDHIPPDFAPLPPRAPGRHDRIRLAYFSADYIRHPVAYQIAGLIEAHDRTRFEVTGISFGRDDRSAIRARLIKGFDSFRDVATWDNRSIAELMRKLEIDIVVDLGGLTKDSRMDILAYRPAPVQVHYLGYPGTLGSNCVDYIIGDPIVLPYEDQPHYAEKIVQLPDTFWVADSTREIAPTPSRREAGLPEDGFVFCVFNKQPKITADMWTIWMRLLSAVPGSVLWLKYADDAVRNRLGQEAAARGVDPQRLIFAPPVDSEEQHLARHRVADLMLDTLPYNAHATASDALWTGLPVLTCRGKTFAGRVAASLLTAAGLPDLVTEDLEAYEALALRLAREPELLTSIRERLARNRSTMPLFDADKFRRNIEAAYMEMYAKIDRL